MRFISSQMRSTASGASSADFTTTAAVVTGDDESAAVAVALNPPRSALSELASSSWPEPVQSDPAPEAFGSWSTSPDDLLPSR